LIHTDMVFVFKV